MEKLLVSTVEQRPPVNVRPSRGQFSIEPHAFFHTGLEREREQPCPVKPVDTENAENKTRRPTTRGGLRLFTLSRGINTGGGERVKNLGKNRAVTRFEWRAFTKSDSSSLHEARGIVLIRIEFAPSRESSIVQTFPIFSWFVISATRFSTNVRFVA